MKTVIIFDFDDALFPSIKLEESFARPTNRTNHDHKLQNKRTEIAELESKITSKEKLDLIKISYVTYRLLLKYIDQYSKRNICIVSASYPGWVKIALSLVHHIGYYSKIYHLLFHRDRKDINNNISIYYPTHNEFIAWKQKLKYNDISLHPMTLWKYQIFASILREKARISKQYTIINTFVIIGQLLEYQAAKKLKDQVKYVYGKYNKNIIIDRIKLAHNPTIAILKDEQQLLYQLCQNKYYQNYSLLDHNGFDLNYFRQKSNNYRSCKLFLKQWNYCHSNNGIFVFGRSY